MKALVSREGIIAI